MSLRERLRRAIKGRPGLLPRRAVLHGREEVGDDFAQRFAFYLGERPLCHGEGLTPTGQRLGWLGFWRALLSNDPVLVAGYERRLRPRILRKLNASFPVAPERDPLEAWAWQEAVEHCTGESPDLSASRERLRAFIQEHRLRDFGKAYLFGTGPSLALASERDWSDGARAVCNTIVRDRELWHHLRPNIFVAADAAYHFGFTDHARAFQADLDQRLGETPTLFIYPAAFHAFVSRRFAAHGDRLVPVPAGEHSDLDCDLLRRFELANMGNVLNILLVVGLTLSPEVCLWGFDGRGPKDELFWKNSSRHSYAELMPSLTRAYPAFFEHFVPKQDREKYVRTVLGDSLEQALSAAEERGKKIVMLHQSHTPALKSRCLAS